VNCKTKSSESEYWTANVRGCWRNARLLQNARRAELSLSESAVGVVDTLHYIDPKKNL
jgi:hypothetical protein